MRIRSVQSLLILLQIFGALTHPSVFETSQNMILKDQNFIENIEGKSKDSIDQVKSFRNELQELRFDMKTIRRQIEKLGLEKSRLESLVEGARRDIFTLQGQILFLRNPEKASDLPLSREKRVEGPQIIFEETFIDNNILQRGWTHFSDSGENKSRFVVTPDGQLENFGSSNGIAVSLPQPLDLLNEQGDPTIVQFSLKPPQNFSSCEAVQYLCLYDCSKKSEELNWGDQCILEIELELYRNHLAPYLIDPKHGQYLYPHFPEFSFTSHFGQNNFTESFITLQMFHGEKKVEILVDGQKAHEDIMDIPKDLKNLQVCSLGLKYTGPEDTQCQFQFDNLLLSRDQELAKSRRKM